MLIISIKAIKTISLFSRYMSPEQAKGLVDQINICSDIYTLGAILHEILSGKVPYQGYSATEILEKIKTTKPSSLLTTGSNIEQSYTEEIIHLENYSGKIPLQLIHISERAMQHDPTDRYPSAEEMALEVLDWLEGAQKKDKALLDERRDETFIKPLDTDTIDMQLGTTLLTIPS